MDAEGVGAAISAEFLQATATGLLLLVIALWLAIGQASLWRRYMWRNGVHTTAQLLNARVEPKWAGYRLHGIGDVRVEFGAGLWGPYTAVAVGEAHTSREALLGPDQVMALIDGLRPPV